MWFPKNCKKIKENETYSYRALKVINVIFSGFISISVKMVNLFIFIDSRVDMLSSILNKTGNSGQRIKLTSNTTQGKQFYFVLIKNCPC